MEGNVETKEVVKDNDASKLQIPQAEECFSSLSRKSWTATGESCGTCLSTTDTHRASAERQPGWMSDDAKLLIPLKKTTGQLQHPGISSLNMFRADDIEKDLKKGLVAEKSVQVIIEESEPDNVEQKCKDHSETRSIDYQNTLTLQTTSERRKKIGPTNETPLECEDNEMPLGQSSNPNSASVTTVPMGRPSQAHSRNKNATIGHKTDGYELHSTCREPTRRLTTIQLTGFWRDTEACLKEKRNSLNPSSLLRFSAQRNSSGDYQSYCQFKDTLLCKTEVLSRRIYDVLYHQEPENLHNSMVENEWKDSADTLKFAFDIYDHDGSGGIDASDLIISLKACIIENSISIGSDTLWLAAETVITAMDTTGLGTIQFADFQEYIKSNPNLSRTFAAVGQKRLPFVSNLQHSSLSSLSKVWSRILKCSIRTKLAEAYWNCLTWARNTWLGTLIPFDEAISFHKHLGRAGLGFATIHAACHAVDIKNWGDPSRKHYYDLAFPEGPPHPSYFDILSSQVVVTGVLLYFIMLVAYAFALDFPRKSSFLAGSRVAKVLNDFNNFWYTHHFFALFYLLLLLHPWPAVPNERNEWGVSDAWAWSGLPILIYIQERLLRFYRQKSWGTQFLWSRPLPGNVLSLTFSKPKPFQYKSGMYVFLNCPSISRYEWHPFTLTSAPQDKFLRVHIAALGDWSGAMNIKFSEPCPLELPEISENKSLDILQENRIGDEYSTSRETSFSSCGSKSSILRTGEKPQSKAKLFIDGPYGAPAQDHEAHRVLLLVGAGIGVTPFASILRNLLNQFEEHRCVHCRKVNLNQSFKLKKIYFYWVVRDPKSSMWFNEELQALKNNDYFNILEVNIHATGIQNPTDVRSTLIQIVQEVYHDETKVDIVTGHMASSLTKFGRPNWTEIFNQIKKKHPKTLVGVFFCGPPVFGKQLRRLCAENSRKKGTNFKFQFERF